MGRPKKVEVKPEKKKTKVTRKPLTKKQKDIPAAEPKKRSRRQPKSAISAPIEEKKIKDRLCKNEDCEFFDASFPGNCLMGPVPAYECMNYMEATPEEQKGELPELQITVGMIGSVFHLPMDREPDLTEWLKNLPRKRMRMIEALVKNLLEGQRELDRYLTNGKEEEAA